MVVHQCQSSTCEKQTLPEWKGELDRDKTLEGDLNTSLSVINEKPD